MKSIGLLKVELHNLERNADTLERIVFNALTALESLPDSQADRYEARVLRKLEKLDELQDAIDANTAELKARGAWEPRSYSGNKYQYNAPKTEKPEGTAQRKGRGRPYKGLHYWEQVSAAMPEQGGTISVYDVMDILDLSKTPSGNLVRHWVSAQKLVLSSSKGGRITYCRASDTSLHQTTLILEAIKAGAVTVRAIAFALGYSNRSTAIVSVLDELEEKGIIENASTGHHARYRVITENRTQVAA